MSDASSKSDELKGRVKEAAGAFGAQGSHLSVADTTGAESLAKVRSYKQGLKAAAKAARTP